MSECKACDELRWRLAQREGWAHDVIATLTAERDDALRRLRALLVDKEQSR